MNDPWRKIVLVLVPALLGPVWLPLSGPNVPAGEWDVRDMGVGSAESISLRGVVVGDADNDNRSEAYFHSQGHVYQYWRHLNAWKISDVLGSPRRIDAFALGDADNDGKNEITMAAFDEGYHYVLLRLERISYSWPLSTLSVLPAVCSGIGCGDGDDDGRREVYLAGMDGHVYRSSTDDGWAVEDIGCAPQFFGGGRWSTPQMCSVAVGDGDNDGRSEVYAASSDNHLYRFARSDEAWSRTDMGTVEPLPDLCMMSAVAIADVDRDGQNEVYGLSGANATVSRYDFDSGSWRISRLNHFGPSAWGNSMAIGDIDSSGVDKIYVGAWDSRKGKSLLLEISHDASNRTWYSGFIGYQGPSINALAIGAVPDYLEVGLFAALDDGHAWEYYKDHVPPANPAVSSKTHPRPGTWYTTTSVQVCWTRPDTDLSGIAGYSYIWDTAPDTIPDEGTDSTASVGCLQKTLADGDGWYFHLRTVDGSGNWNRSAAHFGPLCIDHAPPDLADVVIDVPIGETNGTVVSLCVSANDPAPGSGVALMAFSNDGISWSPWEPFAPARTGWDLADSRYGAAGTDGMMPVFVKVADLAGNELPARDIGSDEIFVDRKAPVDLGIVINDGAGITGSAEVRLRLSGADPEPPSGLMDMSFSNDGLAWSGWEAWGPSRSWSLSAGAGGSALDGKRTVWFRARDRVGNLAQPVFDSIFLDTAAPSVTGLSINGGAPFTNGTNVALSISAADPEPSSGVQMMALSRDGIHWEEWDEFSGSRFWEIGPAEGTQMAFVKVRDVAGNVGAAANASITLDRTAPKVSFLPLPDVVTNPEFAVCWTGEDALSGIRFYDIQYKAKYGTGQWTDWIMNTDQTGAVFIGIDGNAYYFRAKAKDNAGNLGGSYDANAGPVRVVVPRPVVTIDRPAAGSTVKGLYVMNGSSFQPEANLTVVTVELRIDSGPWFAAEGTESWAWVLDSSALPNGNHTLRARAFDGSKYSAEVSREFSVGNHPERRYDHGSPSSWAIRAILVAGLVGAAVVLWIRAKRKGDLARTSHIRQNKRP